MAPAVAVAVGVAVGVEVAVAVGVGVGVSPWIVRCFTPVIWLASIPLWVKALTT